MTPARSPGLVRFVVGTLAVLLASTSALAEGHGHGWHGARYGGGYYRGGGYRGLPPLARTILWAGVTYAVLDGIWYASGANGYAVVQPPVGIVMPDLPVNRTVVVMGGVPYYYINGVYYRERPVGGYEVVNVPGGAAPTAPQDDRYYVYPRNGQSAKQQSSDEFECHRWASSQTGFDPAVAAVGQSAGPDVGAKRTDYQRARAACLDGRGYTVR